MRDLPQSRTREIRPDRREKRLLRAAARGDSKAFEELFTPLLAAGLALARSILADVHSAEDAVQEALMRAFQALGSFERRASLRTWWLRIVARVSCSAMRGRRALPETIEEPGSLHAPGGSQPALDAHANELSRAFDHALLTLPLKQRAALGLRVREGLSYVEIAHVLESSPSAAKVNVFEARRKLVRALGVFLGEPLHQEDEHGA